MLRLVKTLDSESLLLTDVARGRSKASAPSPRAAMASCCGWPGRPSPAASAASQQPARRRAGLRRSRPRATRVRGQRRQPGRPDRRQRRRRRPVRAGDTQHDRAPVAAVWVCGCVCVCVRLHARLLRTRFMALVDRARPVGLPAEAGTHSALAHRANRHRRPVQRDACASIAAGRAAAAPRPCPDHR